MTSRMIRATASLFVALLVLAGCAQAAAPAPMYEAREGASFAPAAKAPAQPAAAGSAGVQSPDSQAIANRVVIRNASLTLVVGDPLAQMDAVTRMAGELQGYVASSSTSKYQQGVRVTITLRVPSEQFEEALRRLRALAVEVREEEISGQDVTAEYTDLNSRLKNLEAAEAQLREIMDNATNTEDVLAVFNELTRIRGEIEVTKGRMQFLAQSAALATINVTLLPDALAQPVQIAGWRPEGVIKDAVEALVSILQGLVSLLIWLVIVAIPVGLVLTSPFVALIVIVRRRSRRKATQRPPSSPVLPTRPNL
ncbi:MAG: DUF4349 domain-containing protein [Anaerolineae bacterium]